MSQTVWNFDAVPEARSTAFGANVTLFAANGSRDPSIFINQMKSAWPWLRHMGRDDPALSFDENGYVATMGDGNRMVSEILRYHQALEGIEPYTGTFRLFGQGSGEFAVGSGLENDLVRRTMTADLPTVVIDGETLWYVDLEYSALRDEKGRPSMAKMFLYGVEEGDHIRDLSLVHHSHLDAFAEGAVFNPDFVADLSSYDTLRFMDWMNTNILKLDSDRQAVDPEERYISTEAFTYNARASGADQPNVHVSSMPIEHIVALANATGANPWINLPVDITDARAVALARYVADNLDPGLTPIWEYGNEVWNSAKGFGSYQFAAQAGADAFDAFDVASYGAAVEWAAYRGPQLYEMIRDILSEDAPADTQVARFIAPLAAWDGPVGQDGSLNTNS